MVQDCPGVEGGVVCTAGGCLLGSRTSRAWGPAGLEALGSTPGVADFGVGVRRLGGAVGISWLGGVEWVCMWLLYCPSVCREKTRGGVSHNAWPGVVSQRSARTYTLVDRYLEARWPACVVASRLSLQCRICVLLFSSGRSLWRLSDTLQCQTKAKQR